MGGEAVDGATFLAMKVSHYPACTTPTAVSEPEAGRAAGSLLIVDGHEDLSMGALADGRDYLTSAEAIRAAEAAANYDNPNGVCVA
jgi:hypothetical protein